MKLDSVEWIFYLDLLSVERTERFLPELGLLLEKDTFPSVMQWARAHLEVHVFSSLLPPKKEEFNHLDEPWKVYRKEEGVLEKKKLLYLAKNYRRSISFDEMFYSEIADFIKPFTVKLLKDWFKKNFTDGPSPTYLWYLALNKLIEIHVQDIKSEIIPPFNATEYGLIKESCRRYYSAQHPLEIRFYIIEEMAKRNGPSLWERVLLNFPPGEGTLKYYPWLSTIKHCIWYRHLRHEWAKLTLELGAEAMRKLVEWVRQNTRLLLTWHDTLPKEPTPL